MVTQNTLRVSEGKYVFFENNFRLASAFDQTKSLKLIKPLISLYKCAPISGLTPNTYL